MSVSTDEPSEETGYVFFNTVLVNSLGGYDEETAMFTVPADGVYLVTMSAAALANSRLEFRLKQNGMSTFQAAVPGADPEVPVALRRDSTDHDGPDTMGRSAIVRYSKGTRLYIESNGDGFHSDIEMQTSWSMFSITDTMRSDVFFFVARHSDWDQVGERVLFDQDYLLPDGDVYDDINDIFTCPLTGAYYFSFTTGVVAEQTVRLQLHVGDRIFELRRTADNHNGIDTLSRSVLVNCEEGDEVYVSLEEGSLYSDDDSNLLSFMGFLYQPAEAKPVAFAAFRTSGLATESEDVYHINYDGTVGQTEINTDGAFDGETFICIESGTYYIYISTAAEAGQEVNFSIRLDGDYLVDLYRASTAHNGLDTMGRGIIVHLNEGQTLHTEMFFSTSYADSTLQTAFFAFLIYSD